MIAKQIKRIPRISNLEKLEQDSKFVQLIVDGKDYLRFYEGLEHAEILHLALEEFGIASSKKPRIKGKRYEAVGMGWVSYHGKIVNFSGGSGKYELIPDFEHIKRIKRYFPKDIEVTIYRNKIKKH